MEKFEVKKNVRKLLGVINVFIVSTVSTTSDLSEFKNSCNMEHLHSDKQEKQVGDVIVSSTVLNSSSKTLGCKE